MSSSNKDYYEILGVPKTATADEIKTAFRKKAHEHHPDKKGGNEAKFKEANEAYQVLGNETKRQQYDRFGSGFQNGQAGGAGGYDFSGFNSGNVNFEDLGDLFGGFGDIFNFGGASGGRRRASRGADLEMVLSLDFMTAVFGAEKEIEFKHLALCDHCAGKGGEPGAKEETCKTCQGRGQVSSIQRTVFGNIQSERECPSCGGRGRLFSKVCSVCDGVGHHRVGNKLKVKIPAGINNGETIRLSGQGDISVKGGNAGDLYLRIKVAPHKKLIRDGYDIKIQETINIKQAILGDSISIETLDGPLKLKPEKS